MLKCKFEPFSFTIQPSVLICRTYHVLLLYTNNFFASNCDERCENCCVGAEHPPHHPLAIRLPTSWRLAPSCSMGSAAVEKKGTVWMQTGSVGGLAAIMRCYIASYTRGQANILGGNWAEPHLQESLVNHVSHTHHQWFTQALPRVALQVQTNVHNTRATP